MFLENIKPFLGTGAVNEAGEDLQTFLENYDPRKYETPSCTVDMAIFAYEDTIDSLKLLMIRRKNHPSIGMWALPGGFVEMRENLEVAAKRELEEETGVTGVPMLQIGAYGDVDRDPRTRVITTLYTALIHQDAVRVQAGDDAADALWFDVEFKPNQTEPSIYQLCLRNDAENITLGAKVQVVEEHTAFFTKTRSKLLQSEGIASDHGMLIADVLLTLRNGGKYGNEKNICNRT